jgi:hypothetical protein
MKGLHALKTLKYLPARSIARLPLTLQPLSPKRGEGRQIHCAMTSATGSSNHHRKPARFQCLAVIDCQIASEPSILRGLLMVAIQSLVFHDCFMDGVARPSGLLSSLRNSAMIGSHRWTVRRRTKLDPRRMGARFHWAIQSAPIPNSEIEWGSEVWRNRRFSENNGFYHQDLRTVFSWFRPANVPFGSELVRLGNGCNPKRVQTTERFCLPKPSIQLSQFTP